MISSQTCWPLDQRGGHKYTVSHENYIYIFPSVLYFKNTSKLRRNVTQQHIVKRKISAWTGNRTLNFLHSRQACRPLQQSNSSSRLVVYEAIGCGLKSFKLVWRCHQLLSGFVTKGHLPRVSGQSRLSANDKGDNEMILGVVHRSSGICLTAEENSGKPQLGDRRWRHCYQSSPQMESIPYKWGR